MSIDKSQLIQLAKKGRLIGKDGKQITVNDLLGKDTTKKKKSLKTAKKGNVLLSVKPLSVNQAWKGRRFKTDKYKEYEKEVLIKLPKNLYIPKKICLKIEFGFSNVQSDLDNPVKCLQDILQHKYGFNDSDIYELQVKKTIVEKGLEFILFELIELKN